MFTAGPSFYEPKGTSPSTGLKRTGIWEKRQKVSYVIEVATKSCTGCRTCEIACSYHHREVFQPSISSIRIQRDNTGAALSSMLYLKDADGHLACDGCRGLEEPLCVKYCNPEGREELKHLLEEIGEE
jgi:Fe-S-cluster-containing dehydrogenase component